MLAGKFSMVKFFRPVPLQEGWILKHWRNKCSRNLSSWLVSLSAKTHKANIEMLAAFRLAFILGHSVVLEQDFGRLFSLFWHAADQFATASKNRAKELEKKKKRIAYQETNFTNILGGKCTSIVFFSIICFVCFKKRNF